MASEKDLNWSMGFIEGEGSFSIICQEVKSKYARHISIHPNIAVSVVKDDEKAIYFLRNLFGGTITFKSKELWIKKGILGARDQSQWRLHSINDCKKFCETIKNYEFKTTKGINFNKWKEAVYIIDSKKHLTKKGLIEILKLREVSKEKQSKNYKSFDYFIKIVDEMEQRNLFSKNEINSRINQGIIVQEKQKAKWIKINNEGYLFNMDTRRNKY